MTDGITDPLFPTDAQLANPAVWREFWNENLTKSVKLLPDNLQLKQEIINWLGFWSKGNHDDRTLALLIPETGR